ncbi:MAG: proprotein convertase P-domain-containing protein [Caldilineaceae bacterium]
MTYSTLRARATDIFGQQSDWSASRKVIIDAAAPLVGPVRVSATAEQSDGAAPTLITDSALDWSGVVTDSVAVASVVVCDNQGENCSAASLTPAAVDEPPAVYGYTDQLDEPLPLDDSAVCTTGVGVVRSFAVGDSFTIAALAVGLRLTHPHRSDLFAALTAPSGTQVVLFDFDHNVAAANVNALFSDMGAKHLADERADHRLDGAYADNIYRPQEKLAAFAGADAAGTWTLTICDRDAATDTGTVDDAALYFTAVAPWRSTSSNWSYSEDVSNSDGVVYTRQILATDEYGQSNSVPVEISAVVDNVPPVLTVTQVVTKVVANTNQQIFSGAVSDGTAVESIGVVVTEPTGRTTTEMITGTIDSWNYALTPAFGGEYRLTVYATDRAGNLAFSDPFSVLALWPLQVTQRVTPEENVAAGALVTYTIEVENPNGVETAQNVGLSMQLSEWLTPVETADAIASATTLSWPAVALEAGAILTKTVLARLTDNLMITSTITGTQPITLPVTEWVNLQGAIISSQAFATTDNLGVSESYQSNFSIEDAPQLSNEVTNEVAPPTATTAPPAPAQEALTEIGQLLATRQGAEGALTSVIWSPDAQYFAAGSVDGTIGLWQLDAAEPVYRLGDQGAAITHMVWSSSPQYFASGSADGLIYLWDLETGEPLLTFEGDGSPITSMLWPADSSSLLYGTADGNVGIVIPENQQSPILVEGHAGVVTSLALSLDNTYLAVGTESGVVLLYDDLGTGNALPFEGHTGAITNLSWSSDGDTLKLLSMAADGTVRQWDVATGEGTVIFDQLGGNSEIAIAPDRRYLALIADDGRVLLWDLANDTPHPLAGQEGSATQVAWSPDGTLLVVGFADGRLQVWQLAAAEE